MQPECQNTQGKQIRNTIKYSSDHSVNVLYQRVCKFKKDGLIV
ncbi:hypothetical protein ALQ48_03141 [Pseudomonas coronafaciens pv. zizaniae]|nr:Uncharacterized protein AC511_0649 [Pseudomonas coronafaciens pv. oryzae]RMO07582.1 hypothetical protein ALQ48_03141 [Pseudomonas coronafaciens pv. zizaniae]